MTYETNLPETAVADLNSRFIHAVRESYANYNTHGARSNKKLRPLHQWVADEMQGVLGENYILQGIRKDGVGREEKIAGKYYDKNVDIAISKEAETPLAIISVKFVTSNFKQNANNYFEHLMGETANIRRINVAVGHLMVLPEVLPYLNRNKEVMHCETIGDAHLQKYIKLAQDENHPHKPDAIGIGVISLPINNLENHNEIVFANLDNIDFSEAVKIALSNELSIQYFICTMKNLVEERG